MQMKLLDILACPACLGELTCKIKESGAREDKVEAGELRCEKCQKTFPIVEGIPRFVSSENYASSFGYQWNLFRAEQIDSISGLKYSHERFYSETGWTPEWLRGKWVVDAGCGAGRFLDVVSQAGAEVVGFDISNAIDASKKNLAGRENVHFVQASIFEPPFRSGAFDACYCIGVIQHTPDPKRALRALPRLLKRGGLFATTIYERKRWTMLYSKYLVRPVTKRLNKKLLLGIIKGSMPVLFPITDVAFRLPYLGRLMQFAIPVSNYVNLKALSRKQRYQWALLDTFDMLAPEYDLPQRRGEVEKILADAGLTDIKGLSMIGLNLVGRKNG